VRGKRYAANGIVIIDSADDDASQFLACGGITMCMAMGNTGYSNPNAWSRHHLFPSAG
jgi:hypothetical protein